MLWVKAFHIFAMSCWFVGLLCLPHLFIYHSQSTDKAEQQRFKQMEERLHHYLATPAMMFAWIFGLIMLFTYAGLNYSAAGWLYIKAVLVLALTGYHFSMGYFVDQFEQDKNSKSPQFFHYYSLIPLAILVLIVVLVVVKPF